MAEAEKERCLELTEQLNKFSKKQDEIRENQALLETCSLTLAEKDRCVPVDFVTFSLTSAAHNAQSFQHSGHVSPFQNLQR